jgi:hypothetical protein
MHFYDDASYMKFKTKNDKYVWIDPDNIYHLEFHSNFSVIWIERNTKWYVSLNREELIHYMYNTKRDCDTYYAFN